VQSWFDYVRDVSVAKYTADSVGRYMEQTSREQINAIESTGRNICGALYEGFSGLQRQLGDVQDQLGQVTRQLDQVAGQLDLVHDQLRGVNQRLGLLLDEAITSNILQQNIAELLRIPDSQKQRQHHIEMGLKFLKNALKDQDLYADALHELLEAEKLMPYDYFVLHRIGMIYFYVPALGNLDKALDYFTKAAKYAIVESHPDAARLNNILNKNVGRKFSQQAGHSAGDLNALAAESYHEAGTLLYALGRFEEAVKMAEKSVKCRPEEGKYLFFLAKFQTRLNNSDSAVLQLQKAIELVPEMAVATLGDFDLNRSKSILDLLEGLNNRVNSQLDGEIRRLEKWLEVNKQTDVSDLSELIFNAKNSLKEGDFSQKRTMLSKLANCDDAMLVILPDFNQRMDAFNNDFIGQERIKMSLVKSMEVAMRNSATLCHSLFLGPVGMGKGTLAGNLAKFMGKNLHSRSSQSIEYPSDLAGLLTNLEEGDILLIEEIHRLPKMVEEYLYRAVEHFKLEIITDQGPNARSVRLNLPRFTLIGTALSVDQLSNEVLSRFTIVECMDSYTQDERNSLALRFATQHDKTPESALKAAKNQNAATPREIYQQVLAFGVSASKKQQ